jgi:poly(ADP-ribose) glycohydrolase ARH3
MPAIPLLSRFRGCLLGLAVGDALGGRFEARSASSIRERFASVESLIRYPQDEIWYTDDTQMAIGIAQTLIEHGEIVENALCKSWVSNYVRSRGYGRGARAVIEAMEEGRDHRAVAESYFAGGSYGNGAAMRVAPIGLVFRDDESRLWDQARLSALPTHLHPFGIEGAQIIARAVAWASHAEQFDRAEFLTLMQAACRTPEFRAKLVLAENVQSPGDLALLGNGIEALESAPTAIASFALTPDSYADTIANLIFLGGDTDTMAAMAGAVSGAFLGIDAIPPNLLRRLETSPQGREFLLDLADQLYRRYDQAKQNHA